MNIIIGGAAGQGVETVAYLLGKSFQRAGLGVISTKDYMSRVRGGHNFVRLSIEQQTPWTADKKAGLLIALDQETYDFHGTEAAKVLFDPDLTNIPNPDNDAIPVTFTSLANLAGNRIMANTVAVGAALALFGFDLEITRKLLGELFAEHVAAQNSHALQSGYEAVGHDNHHMFVLPAASAKQHTIFPDGNEVLGMSALASGCRFISAYPMTPATGIISYLAKMQKSHALVVEQAEDEIAAVNMALGASFAGARSMTATSGGGFALMTEGLSLAGMTETPLVVILAMRPGPATGLPTRTAQSDLDFALHAGHGEFPRAILCATHAEDAFYRLNKAFELADKYQIPVLFLTDQYYADTARTIMPFDFSRLSYNRYLADENELILPYQRYRITDTGISLRVLPGQFNSVTVLADSDEHDEDGHIVEDARMRTRMNNKRLRKLSALAAEMSEPILDGDEAGDFLLIGWGSTYGLLHEAKIHLSAQGYQTTHLHYTDLWPLPVKTITRIFANFSRRFCVENNDSGQFAKLIRRETGLMVDQKILKNDGRPFSTEEIVREVHHRA